MEEFLHLFGSVSVEYPFLLISFVSIVQREKPGVAAEVSERGNVRFVELITLLVEYDGVKIG